MVGGRELYLAGCFIRGTALGGTVLLVALGVFAVDPSPPPALGLAVLVLALGFHAFAYVTNDLVDLPIDRVARPLSPLVTGWIRPGSALGVALLPVPVALAVALSTGGLRAGGLLALAVATMAVYNLYGKRCPVPPLTDGVQGVSWACLLLCASAMTGPGWGPLVWTFAAFTVVFILMANGIHGAVRDIVVDRRFGVRSTALVYGAVPDERGGVTFPPGLRVYAWVLHAVALAVLWVSVLGDDGGYSGSGRLLVASLLLLLTVLSSRFLALAVNAGGDARALRSAGMMHLVTLLAVPVVLLIPRLHPGATAAIALLYVVPLLPHTGAAEMVGWGRQRARIAVDRWRRPTTAARGVEGEP